MVFVKQYINKQAKGINHRIYNAIISIRPVPRALRNRGRELELRPARAPTRNVATASTTVTRL